MNPRSSSQRVHRDRWLISYADLVTLLLACFATTIAAARTVGPAPEIAAVELIPAPAPPAPAAENAVAAPVEASIEVTPEEEPTIDPHESLRALLLPFVAAHGSSVSLIEDRRGLVLSLPEAATFPVGSAALSPSAQDVLRALAGQLRDTAALLRIEGHTDDVPITGGRFASNWELSTARASAVVVFLINQTGFAPERLSAAGYGEHHPRVPNDSPSQRALNRRVDVVVAPGPVHQPEIEP